MSTGQNVRSLRGRVCGNETRCLKNSCNKYKQVFVKRIFSPQDKKSLLIKRCIARNRDIRKKKIKKNRGGVFCFQTLISLYSSTSRSFKLMVCYRSVTLPASSVAVRQLNLNRSTELFY